jgi:spheroidene monooxygenase
LGVLTDGDCPIRVEGVRDLQTFKLCGSGTGEGFTPIPNTAVYAILGTWPDHDAARRAMFGTSVFRAYRDHADEAMTIFMTPASARGKWAGTEPFTPQDVDLDGPIAAMTRATVKPSVALKFWGQEPAILPRHRGRPQRHVQDRNRRSAVDAAGHLLHLARRQDDGRVSPAPTARMPDAIKAVRDGGWFKEELYARFRVDAAEGNGRASHRT